MIHFPARPSFPWPRDFEKHLRGASFLHDNNSNVNLPITRGATNIYGANAARLGDTIRFEGSGYDDEYATTFFLCLITLLTDY